MKKGKGPGTESIKESEAREGGHSVRRSWFRSWQITRSGFLFFGFLVFYSRISSKTRELKRDSKRAKPPQMGLTQIHLLAVYSIAVVLILALTYVSGDDIILQKRSERNRLDMDRFLADDRPRKRPFCNAFTGCGKKRSDESMATLVELNSEPAVEELSKQILSEAKLWEAIHEARAEMEKQRDERPNAISRNLPLALALSTFRRKRAAAFDQRTQNARQFTKR